MSEIQSTSEHTTSFKKIFNIYLKTSRKRVLITIFTGALVFLALTSFFMIWYSYRYNSFYSYIEQNHDWLDDNKSSINSYEHLYGIYTIETDYLTKGIREVTAKLDQIMPDVRGQTTGALKLSLHGNETEYENNQYYLQLFDNNATQIITSNFLEGRLPTNYTELLLYRTSKSHTLGMNDTISLCGKSSFEGNRTFTNCTIVGIVENLDSLFYKEGNSIDLLKINYYEQYNIYSTNYTQFITIPDYYYEFINEYQDFSTSFQADVDINYQFTIEHIKNKKAYIRKFIDFFDTYPTFNYMPGFYVNFCYDLLEALNAFEQMWQIQTISVFASSLPIVFLFGVISIETFNIGTHEQESKYRLIKTHGLKNSTLTKVILNENLLTIGSSFIIGFVTGLLVGFLIFLGLNIPKEVSYFSALNQPIIMISLISLFAGFITLKFIFDIVQARKASITTSMQYKQKRKKFFRRIFSIPEVILMIPGGILTAVGIMLIKASSFYYYPTDFTQLTMLYWFLASIGILLLLISVFLLLTRLITLFWRAIGVISWKSTKSYLSLALKHLSIYGKNYQRSIMAIFILGLGIIPGVIMNKSITSHANLESNLAVGCADIAVEGWNVNNHQFLENITNIEGIDSVTEVNTIKMQIYTFDFIGYEEYEIRFHVIHNVTDYLNIVNFTHLIQDGYTKNEISQLDTNLTYLMSRKYAQQKGYDKNEIFKTNYITDVIYEPLELTFVSDFSYYPLLTRLDLPREDGIILYTDYYSQVTELGLNSETQPSYSSQATRYDMVMSNLTAETILNKSSLSYESNGHLLVKTNVGANSTKIKEEIFTKFGFKAYTKDDMEKIIFDNINNFANIFLIVGSIITIIAIFLFGSINAINIYKQRLRIIETETQIGAKRRLIWGNFTIELVLIVLFPLIVSMGVAVPIINTFSSKVLNIAEFYIKFKPWLPWWLLILTAIIGISVLLSGWFSRMIPLVKSYRPIKQE
ncbi:MAG: hypothetical protein FK733_13735 [Asgard group archaeon]|nr:hypothetical protein [Asgard group archaeon]